MGQKKKNVTGLVTVLEKIHMLICRQRISVAVSLCFQKLTPTC